ncbi:MAG: hypothetical protein ACJ0SL_04620 [Candidatus Rariloculaceae bacterium]
MAGACAIFALLSAGMASAQSLPRTADGNPDLQGIWRAVNRAGYDLEGHAPRHDMPAGIGVVDGGSIPYQPWAAEQRLANFEARATADPLSKCFLPGVPRVTSLEFPFQIFQMEEHVAITYEWQQVYRLIYTNGEPPLYGGIPSWMGNSRGHWDGDVFVVEVMDQNGNTWLDAAGNFHSDAIQVTERYSLRDENTIDYEATIEDPNVFTRPWTLRLVLQRQTHMDRLLEYQCQALVEEENGAFERDEPTWYPAALPADNEPFDADAGADLALPEPESEIRRLADGTPDISGYFMADAGGANYGLEAHPREIMLPPSRGQVIDPTDGSLPYQAWARTERMDREQPHRGYDDPTAHCIVAGVPRSHYVPAPFYILQPPGYVVVLHERMSWRQIALEEREPLPDNIRLWQGDSIGRWEGDSLVVESQNFNGKAWLNEAGDVASHMLKVVETFTPGSDSQVIYRATLTDPISYTRPYTIEMPFNRSHDELLEVACLEDNGDLQHLKDVRDEHRANQN